MKKSISISLLLLFVLPAGLSMASPLSKYKFLKISPQDHKAVVKTPDGELQLVGEGDIVAEKATVVEIAEGRVVLEEAGNNSVETIIIRLKGNKQHVERFRQQGEKAPARVVPTHQ